MDIKRERKTEREREEAYVRLGTLWRWNILETQYFIYPVSAVAYEFPVMSADERVLIR